VFLSRGKAADACKEIWCRHQACFQWRQESGTARSHGIGHQIGRSVVAIDLCAMPVRDSRWRWQLPVKDVGHVHGVRPVAGRIKV